MRAFHSVYKTVESKPYLGNKEKNNMTWQCRRKPFHVDSFSLFLALDWKISMNTECHPMPIKTYDFFNEVAKKVFLLFSSKEIIPFFAISAGKETT